MAHPKEARDKLRQAYIFDQQGLEFAALQADVPFATARRWKAYAKKAGDDWDKVRSAHVLAGNSLEDTGRAILTGFLIFYQKTIEELQSGDLSPIDKVDSLARLADAFNKTTAASRKILPETSQLATALLVLQKMGEFIQVQHPKHLSAFAEILEPFGALIEREFG